MRFGCCAGLDKMRAVQDAGYDYVELPVATVKAESPDAVFEPVRDHILEFDITPEAWNCLLPRDIRVTGPEVDSYRAERFLRTAFARIEELGGEIVVFGSGESRRVPEGFDAGRAREQLTEFLALAGQIAGIHGIEIAIEPLAPGVTNSINTVGEAIEFVRAVDHPFVKVLADLHHMQEAGEPVSVVVEAGNDLVHTHTSDTGRLLPGSGSYPNKEFIKVLRSIGYNDRLSVECDFRDFDAECRLALEFLRAIDAELPY